MTKHHVMSSSENSDFSEEDVEDYKKGGYHPLAVGDRFCDGRYIVTRKLGWGHFSTVWLAADTTKKQLVALKIVKSEKHYTETALDEIKLLETCVKTRPEHPHREFVVELIDWFKHRGPHGVHVVMVFEVLGQNLLAIIRKYHHKGIPRPTVKKIARQILMGLDYLHRECSIIHTDLKPENVLLCVDLGESAYRKELDDMENFRGEMRGKGKVEPVVPSKPLFTALALNGQATPDSDMNGGSEDTKVQINKLDRTFSDISLVDELTVPPDAANQSESIPNVKIADLGNACYTHHHYTSDIQTRQYRSPEAIIGAKYDTSADIWSFGCLVFELLTGDYLFDPQSSSRYTKDDGILMTNDKTTLPKSLN